MQLNQRPHRSLSLYEKMKTLRLAASVIYDNGKESGLSNEEINSAIEPITKALDKVLKESSENDIGSCVLAIRNFKSSIMAYRSDIEFLESKVNDAVAHIEQIQKYLALHMKSQGVVSLEDQGFMVTMTKDEKVTVR
jgi:archaellum component FlaC